MSTQRQSQHADFTEVSVPTDVIDRKDTREQMVRPPQPREVQHPTPRQAAQSWLSRMRNARSGFDII